ncbi:hypothetical protein [Cellulomonas oligotrophica]|uniref:Uncharacterized protein n=1 Tax=Cellulomonas oligotrophica TaxID=931536 RepID=A0A7Y9FHU6_9CELL|nr:hypothetical protein [Cellulomonas oligotrophica]NYD86206.1 hypothetical protein [Cellulomonas oligotrophica]GIG34280.1 hypothetical protein Col01nite_34390 [Cellulomonas oligotrophica]
MRSAYLVSTERSLEDDVWCAAARMGAEVRDHVAQHRDGEGRLVTVFGALDPKEAADWQEGPFEYRGPGSAPDLSTTVAVSVECRWEDLFVSWVARLASLLPYPAWVVDGDGVVWPATDVDPAAVCL